MPVFEVLDTNQMYREKQLEKLTEKEVKQLQGYEGLNPDSKDLQVAAVKKAGGMQEEDEPLQTRR